MMQIACEAGKYKRKLHVPNCPKTCSLHFPRNNIPPVWGCAFGIVQQIFINKDNAYTKLIRLLSDSGAFSLFSVCKLLHPFKGCSAYGQSSSGCLLQSPMNWVQRVAPFSFHITAFDKVSNSQSPYSFCKTVNIMTTQRKHLQEPKRKACSILCFWHTGISSNDCHRMLHPVAGDWQ